MGSLGGQTGGGKEDGRERGSIYRVTMEMKKASGFGQISINVN